MNVVVLEGESREMPAFEVFKGARELVLSDQPLRAENAARFADAEVVSTFICSALDPPVLERLPALKLVATRSTGFDHIGIAYCAHHGITVSTVPTYGANTVAVENVVAGPAPNIV